MHYPWLPADFEYGAAGPSDASATSRSEPRALSSILGRDDGGLHSRYDLVGGRPERTRGRAGAEGLELFDAHVHLFTPRLFDAIWRWFDAHAWGIRYRLYADDVIAFLEAKGVKRFTGLHYSHKPGLAPILNRFAAELGRSHASVVPLGTVLPGEPGAVDIVREALGPLGLRGIKVHCHVQKMAADDPRLDEFIENAKTPARRWSFTPDGCPRRRPTASIPSSCSRRRRSAACSRAFRA